MLYIHIPFCKSRCIYCGFHSGTDFSITERYTDAVCKELVQRHHELPHPIRSIYFGGGTPSALSATQLTRIISTIFGCYRLQSDVEFTVECNPDDVNDALIQQLRYWGCNRISMGVQSFNDKELLVLNRRHTSQQAKAAIDCCLNNSINNISIDLMFGLPTQTLESWQHSLNEAFSLPIQHLSAYNLMVEEQTTLQRMIANQQLSELDDDTQLKMFDMLIDTATAHGFIHYEISNYCKPNYHSRHNSAYWNAIPYVGIGAAAHSFDTTSRHWNINNTIQYINGILSDRPQYDGEQLTTQEQYEEYVFTALRTRQGVDLAKLKEKFGTHYYNMCIDEANCHLQQGHVEIVDNHLKLTRQGIYVSNEVMSDIAIVD